VNIEILSSLFGGRFGDFLPQMEANGFRMFSVPAWEVVPLSLRLRLWRENFLANEELLTFRVHPAGLPSFLL